MEGFGQDIDTCRSQITGALEDMAQSRDTVQKIAEYCRSDTGSGDDAALMEQARKYTTDTLQNLVYHVHNSGLQLANFLDVETNELNKSEVKIRSLADVRRQQQS